jgi:hypothetical protein|eukprot:CAMPEP_0168316300 /NCGR_PEP_ID=MMETSP0210-20121227/15156_1 /TAXON_ID=40633 /ORGANISM="Condylostoma magnum, Strain COL2" /LENGTH=74 /DNA_ID=CAMNT_0008296425 /DNA_START=624 /DNA_END=848 /DNA_ORIENTATION=+
MKKVSYLNAKAIGIAKNANLELLRELESNSEFIEGSVNISVGNPGDEGLGVRVRASTSNNTELQEALSVGGIEL